MEFGRKIIHESYFKGELKSSKTELSIPELITERSQVLKELMGCLDLIDKQKTNKMTIEIDADPKTFRIKMITKTYKIDTNSV